MALNKNSNWPEFVHLTTNILLAYLANIFSYKEIQNIVIYQSVRYQTNVWDRLKKSDSHAYQKMLRILYVKISSFHLSTSFRQINKVSKASSYFIYVFKWNAQYPCFHVEVTLRLDSSLRSLNTQYRRLPYIWRRWLSKQDCSYGKLYAFSTKAPCHPTLLRQRGAARICL